MEIFGGILYVVSVAIDVYAFIALIQAIFLRGSWTNVVVAAVVSTVLFWIAGSILGKE